MDVSLCNSGVGDFVNQPLALHFLDLQLGEGEHLLASASVAQNLWSEGVSLRLLGVLYGVVFAIELHSLVLLSLEVQFLPLGVGVLASSVVLILVDDRRKGGFRLNGSCFFLNLSQSILFLP